MKAVRLAKAIEIFEQLNMSKEETDKKVLISLKKAKKLLEEQNVPPPYWVHLPPSMGIIEGVTSAQKKNKNKNKLRKC